MPELHGFNATDHRPMDSYDALPKGKYLAIATDSETRTTKSGDGSYLQLAWEIVEGEFKGRRLWSRLNLDNPNRAAVEIAERELADICRAVGVLRPKESAELHNVPIYLKVGVETRKDTGEQANRIRGYEAASNRGAAQPPTASAAASAPASRPRMSEAPANPPWKQ